MPLDFHIAKARDEAARARPDFSLSVDVHAALFSRSDLLRDCPQLRRMDDYYADVAYSGSELSSLILELERVTARLAAHTQVQVMLRRCGDACRQAIAEGRALYGFAE
jgi:hypothetical protein